MLANQVNLNKQQLQKVKGKSFDIPKKGGSMHKVHQVSGICSFLYEAETWDEKSPVVDQPS